MVFFYHLTNRKRMSQKAPNGDATRASEDEIKRIQAEKLAEKRAEIAARVAKAREDQADQAAQAELMEQFVSMFVQGAKAVTQKFEDIGKNPQKVPKGTQGAIFRAFRNLLKKPWASLAEFCQEFGQTFKDSKSEFAEGSAPWHHLVGCWDFQAEWYDTLPKGTVLLEHF